MKKLLITTSILATLVTSSAFAKTEGNIVGFDILQTKAQSKNSSNGVDDEGYSHKKGDSAVGFGVSYKHAFNFNKFFIAPGVFYQKLGTEAKSSLVDDSTNWYNQSVSLNSRLGLSADFGYDVTDKFSFYVPVGFNRVSYEVKTHDHDDSPSSISTKRSGNENGYFYGLGFSFSPVEKIAINFEYNKLSELKLNSPSGATINAGTISAKTNVDIFKVGLSYNF